MITLESQGAIRPGGQIRYVTLDIGCFSPRMSRPFKVSCKGEEALTALSPEKVRARRAHARGPIDADHARRNDQQS